MADVNYTVEDLLATAKAAASAGARVLSQREFEALEISTKSEAGDIVTNIDLEAEHAVRNTITMRRPIDAISGEELDDRQNSSAQIRWSVDPLDGTTNYARAAPHYCTSVAAMDTSTGQWLVGVVVAPALERAYFASLGGGSWLTTPRGTAQLSGPTADNSSRLLGLGFSYSSAVRREQYAAIPKLMSSFSDIRSLGSAALGLCEVADGKLDAFFESDLFEFDWAAGALIAEEAGVSVTKPSGPRGGIATGPFTERELRLARPKSTTERNQRSTP